MDRTDKIQFAMGYTGCFFMTGWGLWSIYTYNIAFVDYQGYIAFIGKTLILLISEVIKFGHLRT